jgi:large subunit ribosomal protein L10
LPLTRSEKAAAVDEITERLKRAEAIVVTDYRGLSVAQLGKLRRDLRAKGAEYHVVKNTLTLRALADAGMEAPAELLSGPTGLAFLFDDLSGPTKALKDCAKDTNILTIRGGLMGGSVLDAKGIEALADLPSREQLLAQLLGVLQAPQRQLVTILNTPLRDLVGVINAHAASEVGEAA